MSRNKGHCKICDDERRPDVDGALLLKPIRAVASEFGLARATLHKHLRHSETGFKKSVNRLTAAYTKDMRKYIRQAQETTIAVMKAAQARGDSDTALRAASEVRAHTETMRKLLTKTAEPEKPKAEKREVRIEYQ